MQKSQGQGPQRAITSITKWEVHAPLKVSVSAILQGGNAESPRHTMLKFSQSSHSQPWWRWRTTIIPVLGRHRHADLYDFKASMAYIVPRQPDRHSETLSLGKFLKINISVQS